MIKISDRIVIDDSELTFSMSKSGGPGGQNVNKVNTKIELSWNVNETQSLTESEKERIHRKLHNRIDQSGHLHVTAQSSRSAHQNRQEAEKKLIELIRSALKKPTVRRKTKTPERVRRNRLKSKRQRGELKRMRKSPQDEDF